MCLRAQRRFTAVLCGGKRCQKVSEAAALRAPASSYEALLLSAGKCGQSPSCRKCWGKSCICQHTNTQSHLYKCRQRGAVSSSTSLPEAHPHQSLLVQEQFGCKPKPQPPLFPVHPNPLPHEGAGFLHSLALTPALLTARFFKKKPLWMEGRTINPPYR